MSVCLLWCGLKGFETSLQKCQGHPIMDGLSLAVSKGRVCSDLSQKPLSIYALCLCACVCCIFYVFTPIKDWEPVLQGPQKKTVPLWFNYHSELSWRDNKRLWDSTVCFTQVSWHKVEQRGLSILKCALTCLISPFCLFPPHAILQPASMTWHLIPHVSEPICTKIQFAGNCHCHTVPDMTLLIVYCLLKGSPLADVVAVSCSSSGPH